MSLINSIKGKQQIKLIDYKAAAEIWGLAPKTVANGGAGTAKFRKRIGPRTIRFIESEVIADRDARLNGQSH
jgi:hypothetical protein